VGPRSEEPAGHHLGRRASGPPALTAGSGGGLRRDHGGGPGPDPRRADGGLALTAIETAIALGASQGSRVLDRVFQNDLTWRELYRCYCRHIGRRGWKAAAGQLGAAADRAASEAERRLVTLLHQAGLLGWQLDVEVVLPTGRYRLDLAFVHERIAVEVDGWAWHSDVERFRANRRRQNALVLAGWTVLRFTWDDLTNRPEQVVAQIQAALAGAANSP